MKTTYIVNTIFRAICVIAALILLYHGIKGWGWFLFIAFFSGINITSTSSNK